jgi:hypothetical protein
MEDKLTNNRIRLYEHISGMKEGKISRVTCQEIRYTERTLREIEEKKLWHFSKYLFDM